MAEVTLYLGAVLVLAVLIGTVFTWKPSRGVAHALGETLVALGRIFGRG